MKFSFFLMAYLSIMLSASAQSQFVGTIVNSGDESPIANASIQFGDIGVTSDESGKFVIQNPDYPIILEISHLGFYSKTVIIKSRLESGMTIRMSPKTTQINEIEIVGERIKRFFQNQYYYIVDYFLYDNSILTIGYKNSRLSQGQLTLIDMNQDTIASLPISKPKRIFQDGFGNVHVFAGDSVFQVFVKEDQLFLLYPTLASEMAEDLLKFQFQFHNHFVFKEISGEGQANEYYAIDTLAKEKITLETVYQEQLFSAADAAVRYRKWKPNLSGKVSRDPGTANALFEYYVYDLFVTHIPVASQIFKYNNELVIFDLVNNSSLVYNHNMERIKKIKNTFPRHHKRHKDIIQDPVTEKLYWLDYQGSKVLLGEIDIDSGKVINQLETPSLPFIENIQIRNGVIWFLYQPRLGETVRSLYRMSKQ